MDNGTQFTEKKFFKFYDDHHIRVDWSAVAHLRMNGQVDQANGIILLGLKPWIFDRLKNDLEYGSLRVRAYDEQGNQASLEDTQDQLDEARDVALLHSAKYQQALRRYHSRKFVRKGWF
ncbi:uncharacterized protein [Setaria viridis]|uniref:uncharacterized protein n=1 Tax=Setaria viridis TaxID=4556 RepID=UPI001493A0C6|nr:uncharacterized protein LOC117864563 [Setaria viridis]